MAKESELTYSEKVLKDKVESFLPDELAHWLLQGFANDDFGMFLGDELSASIQLVDLALSPRQDESVGQSLRLAAVRAIEMWQTEDSSRLDVLSQLTSFSMGIEVDNVALFQNLIEEGLKSEKWVQVALAVSTLARNNKAVPYLATMSAELDRYPYGYEWADFLFLGLIEHDPNNYPKYFAQFAKFINSDFYSLGFIFARFYDLVSPEIFVQHLSELSEADKEALLRLLVASNRGMLSEDYSQAMGN